MRTYISSYFVTTLLITTILIGTVTPVAAQDDGVTSDKWEFTVAPYVLFPYMNGFVAIQGNESAVAIGPGDIFSNLNFGAMLYTEAHNKDWAIMMDILYMHLEETGESPVFGRSIETTMKQLMWEVAGMKRLSPCFELGIGLRLNSIEGGLLVQEGMILPELDVSDKETWVDPFIAARLEAQLDHPWRLGVRGDIGGFGISSDFTWQLYPYFGHRFSDLFEMILAYRWLSIDYSSGSGDEEFKYDMINFGPEIGFLFHF